MKDRAKLLLATLLLIGMLTMIIHYSSPWNEQLEWKNHEISLEKQKSKIQKLANQIQSAQGKVGCEVDSHCRIVGLGARVCEKYKSFLIYSILDVNESNLLALVSEFNQLNEKLDDLNLSINQCGVVPAPVHCISGHCRVF